MNKLRGCIMWVSAMKIFNVLWMPKRKYPQKSVDMCHLHCGQRASTLGDGDVKRREMPDLTLQLSLERTVENKNVDNVGGKVFQRETPSV